MAFHLSDLPYSANALAPYISEETLRYHHGKHHATYVNKLNGLLESGSLTNNDLPAIIRDNPTGPIFNNAAQIWNHGFTGTLSHQILLILLEKSAKPLMHNLAAMISLRKNYKSLPWFIWFWMGLVICRLR